METACIPLIKPAVNNCSANVITSSASSIGCGFRNESNRFFVPLLLSHQEETRLPPYIRIAEQNTRI